MDNYEGHAYLIRRLTDALDAATQAQSEVDEWKRVPREPTDRMMIAGGFSFAGACPNNLVFPKVRKVWEDMLSAAPDAASRSIPAGEDAELVRRLEEAADRVAKRAMGHDVQALISIPRRETDVDAVIMDAADRLSSLSSELEQVRAENARLQKQIADMEASFEANVQEMSERFRAVNIGRVLEQSQHDVVGLIKRVATAEARLEKAETIVSVIGAKYAEITPDPSELQMGASHPDSLKDDELALITLPIGLIRSAARLWIEGGE